MPKINLIVDGLDDTFEIKDEVYMYPVLEDSVTSLLRNTNFKFTADNFRYGGDEFEKHPKGSNLVGWTKTYRNSPILYIMFGHWPKMYFNESYRSLIVNSIQWATSDGAVNWVKSNNGGV